MVETHRDTLRATRPSPSKKPTERFRDDHIRNSVVPGNCTRITSTPLVFGIVHDPYRRVKGNVSMEAINALDWIGSNDTYQKKIRSKRDESGTGDGLQPQNRCLKKPVRRSKPSGRACPFYSTISGRIMSCSSCSRI